MISKEAVSQMIQEQLSAKLAGDKMLASVSAPNAGEAAVKPVVEKPPEPIVKSLDDVDVVRLNNLLLKRRVETLTREIEDSRRGSADEADNRDNVELQQFLIDKYNIDTSSHKLVINPQARTLTLSPL